jgi:asparagine synthase (glutamine-hydrolysing)
MTAFSLRDHSHSSLFPHQNEEPTTFVRSHDLPDSENSGSYATGFLGHTRLTIVDLSVSSRQPMHSGSIHMTFNGEVYNYRELRSELQSHGCNFTSTGDSEVLLRGFETWGQHVFTKCEGQLAAVFWDTQKRQLTAARDRLGKKPLYYTQLSPDSIAISSEIKGLWALGVASAEIAPSVALPFLILDILPKVSESFFKGIKQLPGGHVLTWTPGQEARVSRYWEPDPSRASTRLTADHLRQEVIEATRKRCSADVPISLSLSGGIDSSCLFAAVHKAGLAEIVTACSATSSIENFDETPNISRIRSRYPSAKFLDIPTYQKTSYDEFLRFLAAHDEPLRYDGIFNEYVFIRRIREAGFKVLLTGEGGDELFYGYPWYVPRYTMWLLKQGRILAGTYWAWWNSQVRGISLRKSFQLSMTKRSAESAMTDPLAVASSWLSADTWNTFGAERAHELFSADLCFKHFRRREIFEQCLPGLLKDEDRNSMAHGVESRIPYLDPRLVELALSADPKEHLRRGFTKFSLRNAFHGTLPDEVLWNRKKIGFYVPVVEQFPDFNEHATALIKESSVIGILVDVAKFVKEMPSFKRDEYLGWRAFSLANVERQARNYTCKSN